MSNAKPSTKALQQKRRKRRQWLTFLRMVRYGTNNFTRNAWLTIAATAVMTITLLIIFMSAAAQNILNESVDAIAEKVDMSIYLKTGTTEEQAQPIISDLHGLSNVKDVSFISSETARQKAAEDNKSDSKVLDAITEATNKLPATLRIQLFDINDTSQLDSFVKDNQNLKEFINPDRPPSFSGDRRQAIKQISSWTVMAQRIGLIASIIFVAISSLIIFNTIRMAIFSRKEEIQMMKLIGADKHFIRGPFVVEAVVYGFIAALVATGVGFMLLSLMHDKLSKFGIDVQTTLSWLMIYLPLVLLVMIALGALIGTVSSLLATRRYLKI
ncbi:MAG TPA: permease-like cell division protein FtsX [Patescibacteria group bacterium]|jgi:cell division transport system permease protein|nr:permease-like cell division protein FtsX [Patescibacteria group bacterium]